MFQMKEQDKSPGEELSEVEISNLPNKEFMVKDGHKYGQRTQEKTEWTE